MKAAATGIALPAETVLPLVPGQGVAADPQAVLQVPDFWSEGCRHLVKKDRVMKRLIPQSVSYTHLTLPTTPYV